MKCESIENYSVYDYSLVKYIETGNIKQIISLSHKNNECPIQKINKDEYVLVSSGEVIQCNHIENRSQDINSIRLSISRLRDIINTNFFGGDNELWITLTFGDNKVYNPNDLCSIFERFMKRLRYFLKDFELDYIYVPEPHEKGDWHIHLLLKADKSLYIENSKLREIWGYGFVKVNRLDNSDNVGAYITSYLINIKDGDVTKKGARLYLYPPQHKLYRCSRGIKIPEGEYMTYNEAMKKVGSDKLTYSSTIFIQTDNGFENTIHREYFNSKR